MNFSASKKNRLRIPRTVVIGFLVGVALATAEMFLSHGLVARYTALTSSVSLKAPQGSDLYVYMSLVRAVLRGPNLLTYSYPFPALDETVPAVAFQFPVTLAAWISLLTGIPAAFEILRIAGAGIAGAMLGWITGIFPAKHRRGLFLVFTIFGGGMIYLKTFSAMYEIAGWDGLTQPWNFLWESRGELLWWAPYLAENLYYPLECVYHGIFFGAVAALLYGRYRLALLCGVLTWASNPFTAVALYAAVLPWWLWNALDKRNGQRKTARIQGSLWLLSAAVAALYYGPYLNQWRTFRVLGELYRMQITPPLSASMLLSHTMPWIIAVALSAVTPLGRKHFWGKPKWRLFGLMVLAHIALYQQGLILGENALQPYHYNRGYLHFALTVSAWRMGGLFLMRRRILNRAERKSGEIRASLLSSKTTRYAGKRLLVLFSLTLFFDQLFFFLYRSEQRPTGFVTVEYKGVLDYLAAASDGKPQWVYTPPNFPQAGAISAFTNHLPYVIWDSMVTPDYQEKMVAAEDAIAKGAAGNLRALGIGYALVYNDTDAPNNLEAQGWTTAYASGRYRLMIPGEESGQ